MQNSFEKRKKPVWVSRKYKLLQSVLLIKLSSKTGVHVSLVATWLWRMCHILIVQNRLDCIEFFYNLLFQMFLLRQEVLRPGPPVRVSHDPQYGVRLSISTLQVPTHQELWNSSSVSKSWSWILCHFALWCE